MASKPYTMHLNIDERINRFITGMVPIMWNHKVLHVNNNENDNKTRVIVMLDIQHGTSYIDYLIIYVDWWSGLRVIRMTK